VSCLGHSDESVRAAIRNQLDQLAFAHTGFFSSDPAEELADLLVASAPRGLDRVYLVSGGSEAVEAALKLARQYYFDIGQPERQHNTSRRQSYHGNTLGALAAGGNELRRKQFQPLLIETTQIALCYEYRDHAPDETPEAYGQRVANELEADILCREPGSVMCFIAETVGGATAGVVPPVPGYFTYPRDL
jgi:adenosylmethionine-8-amino-7-oxononanoate aminotransferase